jgi:hypothetical protein
MLRTMAKPQIHPQPRARGEPDQVEVNPSHQRVRVGRDRRIQSGLFELPQYEIINAFDRPTGGCDLGKRRPRRRHERPVPGVLRSLSDPAPEQADLIVVEAVARIRRRHSQLGIFGRNALDQQAGLGIAGQDGAIFHRCRSLVQPQFGLAGFVIAAVTGKTIGGKNRPYLIREANSIRRAGRRLLGGLSIVARRHRDGAERHCKQTSERQ